MTAASAIPPQSSGADPLAGLAPQGGSGRSTLLALNSVEREELVEFLDDAPIRFATAPESEETSGAGGTRATLPEEPWDTGGPDAGLTDAELTAEGTADDRDFTFDRYPPFPHPLKRPFSAIGWIIQLAFGMASLTLLLAIVAAIPIVNFLALGYLLEAEGRVARTGKLSYAVPLLPLAPRLGTIALGLYLWLIPVRLVSAMAADARVIAPDSGIAKAWGLALVVVSVLVTAHLILALARGGGFFCFIRPIKNFRWLWQQLSTGQYFAKAETAIYEFISALRLGHHFSLGLRGFLGTFLWLFIPTALLGVLRETTKPGQVLLTLLGGLLLVVTLTWVPFLQAHFAAENRFSAFRELRTVRELNRRSPMLWLLATIVLYALALPLYLFKVAAPPQDAMWFVTLIFIATIYPAKIMVAYAYAWARRRDRRQFFLVRWVCTLALLPLLVFYVFIVFLTPTIGAAGRRVLFEQHALLLPVPF